MGLNYGGEVLPGSKEEQDEDEAQLDPEILALIEKEVGGGGAGGDGGKLAIRHSPFVM